MVRTVLAAQPLSSLRVAMISEAEMGWDFQMTSMTFHSASEMRQGFGMETK